MYIYIYIMKSMCPPGYHHNAQWLCGNSCTWAHDVRLHILVPMNQRVLNKQSKERNISDHK